MGRDGLHWSQTVKKGTRISRLETAPGKGPDSNKGEGGKKRGGSKKKRLKGEVAVGQPGAPEGNKGWVKKGLTKRFARGKKNGWKKRGANQKKQCGG